jgi:hypothetical protein
MNAASKISDQWNQISTRAHPLQGWGRGEGTRQTKVLCAADALGERHAVATTPGSTPFESVTAITPRQSSLMKFWLHTPKEPGKAEPVPQEIP